MLNIMDIKSKMAYDSGMENKREIGKNIKNRRLSLNLRMDDVAKEAGITRSTLSAIENGSGNPSLETIMEILRVLGMSLQICTSMDDIRRKRATRTNTIMDKKINRFVVMCVEQYASSVNKGSQETYRKLLKEGIIRELIDDYEDMHGMSTYSINEYIDCRLEGGSR